MPSRILPVALVALMLLAVSALIRYNQVWRITPLPDYVGSLLYQLETAREHAAFTASLLAQSPALEIPVPVLGVRATQVADTYGEPRGNDRKHEGVDIFADRGTFVVSATDGIVVRTGANRLGGNIVFVLGPGGERYYYAHLDEIDTNLYMGKRVDTSTILGRVGTTGNATGTPPHLHFGIYGEGGARNPYERLR